VLRVSFASVLSGVVLPVLVPAVPFSLILLTGLNPGGSISLFRDAAVLVLASIAFAAVYLWMPAVQAERDLLSAAAGKLYRRTNKAATGVG
jgi:hypothetical protein